LTRVTGEIFHCRLGKANFFFFTFMSVNGSEPQSNFVRPNTLQLLSIAKSNDTQTPPQKALF
jgi:hypothetical protein